MLGTLALAGCAHRDRPGADRAVLEYRVRQLESTVERARRGPLVPVDQALVVVDQRLMQDLLDAALPYEAQVAGRYRIRISGVTVSCYDGAPLVHLDGRASFADRPETDAFVVAHLFGALREFALAPEDSVLRARIEVIAVDLRRVKLFADDNVLVKGLLRDLTDVRLESFQSLDYTFEVPVRVVKRLVVPALDAKGIHIDRATIPLETAVTGITAARGKLWISLRLFDRLGTTAVASGPGSPAETAP